MDPHSRDDHRRGEDEARTCEDDETQYHPGQEQIAAPAICSLNSSKQNDHQEWIEEEVKVLAEQLEREMPEHVDVHECRERQQEGQTADRSHPLSHREIR